MSQAEDLILIGQVNLLGSRRAFDSLVKKYQGDVRRLLLNLTGGDGELAADIAQETFLKAWMYIGSYKATARFRTWLFSIAYNVFYDYAALQRKHAHRDLSDCEYYLTEGHSDRIEKISTFIEPWNNSVRPNVRRWCCFTSNNKNSRISPVSWTFLSLPSRRWSGAERSTWHVC